MLRSKKGQTAGLITTLVFGIATLIVGIIIAFVVVNTLNDADLLQEGRVSVPVTNESGYINATGYTLSGASADRVLSGSFVITALYNGSDSLLVGNASVSDAGVVTNASTVTYGTNATISYTYTVQTETEVSADNLNGNFTESVDNVSSKIPTVLLITAIVLILGVLVLLVAAWRGMNYGGGGL